MPARALTVISLLLTGLAVFICLRIEAYNIQAGGYLPRRPNEYGDITTWRAAPSISVWNHMESQFRHEHERAVEGRAEPFVLTHDQRLEILDAMEEARMWCSFRAFVSCWGLLQYLLAPAAMLCSVVTFGFGLAKSRSSVKGQRPIHPIVIGTSCVILSAACIVMMLYRGYFSSLG